MSKLLKESHIDSNPHFIASGMLANRYFIKIGMWGISIVILLSIGVWVELNYFSIFTLLAFCFAVAICCLGIYNIYPAYKGMKIDQDMYRKLIPLIKKDSTHNKALKILDDYNTAGIPFCLFLRSFETETYDWLTPKGTGEYGASQNIVTYGATVSEVETILAKALKDKIPIVAVSDPSTVLTTSFIFPRLEISGEDWKGQVENLIEHAAMIIFDCQVLAPGVVSELEIITRLNKNDSTIMIIPEDSQNSHAREIEGMVRPFGAIIDQYPIPKKEDSQISEFKRIIRLPEISFDTLHFHPAFADLLDNMNMK